MSDGLSESGAAALALLDTALAALDSLDLTAETDAGTVALWRELEGRRRRFEPIDQQIVLQVQRRGLPAHLGYRSLVAMGREVLRVSGSALRAREQAAESFGRREGLTGAVIEPVYPAVAAAQADGSIGPAAAAAIARMLDRLPAAVQAEHGVATEIFLVEQARTLDVDLLRRLCVHTAHVLDPDGRLRSEKDRQRLRDLWIRQRADGSSSFGGEATAELTEYMLAALDALAAPRPHEGEGEQRDPRAPGQRRHDALLETVKGAMRAGRLPAASGVTTTVMLIMDENAYRSGEGVATTGHGAVLHAETARSWLDGGTRLAPVTLGPQQQVTATGRVQRLFTEGQRLAMIARDLGCSFPGCDVGPQWTEAHHVTEWRSGGHTALGNGTLLCRYHHARFARAGWECTMLHDVPHWVPPAWIDPERRPRRNHAHARGLDQALVPT